MKSKLLLPFLVALPLAVAACSKNDKTAADANKPDAYPLTTCVVSGEPLSPEELQRAADE